jgi:hypothetical protein
MPMWLATHWKVRSETIATAVIFVLSALVQGNAILNHGYMGQDYPHNTSNLQHAIEMQAPFWWVRTGTNPPLLYWLGSLVHYLSPPSVSMEVLALLFVILNLLALWIVVKLARVMIQRPVLRVSALLTLAFLPFRLIHSMVVAADALTSLPFFLVVWLFYGLLRAGSPGRQLKFAALICATLALSQLIRYTFFSMIPAALIVLFGFRRCFASRKALALTVALIVAIPSVVALDEMRSFSNLPHDPWQPSWRHEVEWKTLLSFKEADWHILRAPPFDEMIVVDGQSVNNLLINNKHSYPALLHLSIFTDIMNIFQYDPSDSYIGPRSEVNQVLMTVGVNLALPLSLFTTLSVLAYVLRSLYFLRKDSVRPARGRALGCAILLVFSIGYFASITLCLPFIQNAYPFGYWLPRLVVPALMGFFILSFVFLDEFIRSRAVHFAAFVYAFVQACVHLSFLWPRAP